MVLGAVIAAVHVLAHMEVFGGPPPGVVDLVAGYPAAMAVFIAGAIMAGR